MGGRDGWGRERERESEGVRVGAERDDFMKFYRYFFPNYILSLKFIYL